MESKEAEFKEELMKALDILDDAEVTIWYRRGEPQYSYPKFMGSTDEEGLIQHLWWKKENMLEVRRDKLGDLQRDLDLFYKARQDTATEIDSLEMQVSKLKIEIGEE